MAIALKSRLDVADREERVLQPGRNAWRVERAERAAVLVDGGAYFGALRQAMRNAGHSIYIVGWDINSQTRLVDENGETGDFLPETLGDFLSALVKKKPRLTIKLLLWDYSVVYSLSRELSPSLALQWKTPPQIELCMDDGLPTGSSHHQKIVVIDDCVAFSGGLDLTIRRWDSADHSAVNPQARRSGGRRLSALPRCADAGRRTGGPGAGGDGAQPLGRSRMRSGAAGASERRSVAGECEARVPQGRCRHIAHAAAQFRPAAYPRGRNPVSGHDRRRGAAHLYREPVSHRRYGGGSVGRRADGEAGPGGAHHRGPKAHE